MSTKSLNYISYKNLIKDYNNIEDSFLLIAHVQDMNSKEFLILKSLCKKNNIKFFNIKISLFEKLYSHGFKNSLFKSLLAGPTKIFLFEDLEKFLTFTKNPYVKKNIIPLTVYVDESFFSYPDFLKYIKFNNKLTLSSSYVNFLLSLNSVKNNFLASFNVIINNFFLILKYLIKNKK